MRLPTDQNASGRSFDTEELTLLREVLDSGTLTSTKGQMVKALESAFAAHLGASHVIACSSGTAAIHAAVAAVDPEPGDEIITTAITDMGALSPILYQGAIPVFADVDPVSGNVTPESVLERLSSRTRAIVVTHLFGSPADTDGIMRIAHERGLLVIEDAAQAYGAVDDGRPVGTIGDIGCFSLQQGKHITTGEGGIVVTSDDALARHIRVFVNKAWPYGEPNPDHEFLALNYRMTELQGAVALAQLAKLKVLIEARIDAGDRLTDHVNRISGLEPPLVRPGTVHSYWRYALRVAPDVDGGPDGVAARLRDYDVASAPRYVRKPAFACAVFRDQRTFGSSRWPFTLASDDAVDYSPDRYPGTHAALDSVLVLPFNEHYGDDEVDHVAESLRVAAGGS